MFSNSFGYVDEQSCETVIIFFLFWFLRSKTLLHKINGFSYSISFCLGAGPIKFNNNFDY